MGKAKRLTSAKSGGGGVERMHAVAKVHKCEMRSFSRYQLQAMSVAIFEGEIDFVS